VGVVLGLGLCLARPFSRLALLAESNVVPGHGVARGSRAARNAGERGLPRAGANFPRTPACSENARSRTRSTPGCVRRATLACHHLTLSPSRLPSSLCCFGAVGLQGGLFTPIPSGSVYDYEGILDPCSS